MVTNKPKYAVPTLAEINSRVKNDITVVSTFSGCGGSSLGYKMAGLDVRYACEFIPAAIETYRANFPTTFVDTRDIRTIRGAEILERLNKQPGELDLLDGSPPCASFSTAGKREKHWGKVKAYSDTKQRTDDLFFEFARLVNEISPRVFVAENVSGLIKGKAKGYFLEIIKLLKSFGYQVKCKLLDAKWLGVPQSRTRTIFVGVRNDLCCEPQFPKPLPFQYSVAEALETLYVNSAYIGTVNHEASIEKYCTGREWDRIAKGGQSKKYFSLVRVDPNKPCPTICASHGSSGIASVTHYREKRKFYIDELKRLCSFPDDFILTGSYAQQYERLGRAVPPLMMMHIAATIRDKVFYRHRRYI